MKELVGEVKRRLDVALDVNVAANVGFTERQIGRRHQYPGERFRAREDEFEAAALPRVNVPDRPIPEPHCEIACMLIAPERSEQRDSKMRVITGCQIRVRCRCSMLLWFEG